MYDLQFTIYNLRFTIYDVGEEPRRHESTKGGRSKFAPQQWVQNKRSKKAEVLHGGLAAAAASFRVLSPPKPFSKACTIGFFARRDVFSLRMFYTISARCVLRSCRCHRGRLVRADAASRRRAACKGCPAMTGYCEGRPSDVRRTFLGATGMALGIVQRGLDIY